MHYNGIMYNEKRQVKHIGADTFVNNGRIKYKNNGRIKFSKTFPTGDAIIVTFIIVYYI